MEMLTRYAKLFAVALAAFSLPVRAQAQPAALVPGTDQTCLATLADGRAFESHRRILQTHLNGQVVYEDVRAYYMPRSGEFLFSTVTYSESGYLRYLKDIGQPHSCNPSPDNVIQLVNGEWTDFSAITMPPRINVLHSSLRFPSIEKAWQYVAVHAEECEVRLDSTKCSEEIRLFKELDRDFFRPASMRCHAQGYSYNPLVSVERSGATWRLKLKDADNVNRALVVLDDKFKLVKVEQTTNSRESLKDPNCPV